MGGNLGANTCSVLKLDPTGSIPREPLLDLIPGLTPLRVTLDMVDSESASFDYDVTTHSIQSTLDVTSNVHKRLRGLTITGTLGATLPLLPVIPPPVPGSLLRLDLVRLKSLVDMADERALVMVVTPRVALARAFFTKITQNWSPSNAESTSVTLTFIQARIVSPLTGDLVAPDYPAQEPGNNAATDGGQSSTSSAGTSATPSPTVGVAPTIGGSVPPP
jgi:hypothetical protein